MEKPGRVIGLGIRFEKMDFTEMEHSKIPLLCAENLRDQISKADVEHLISALQENF
jgi:hypothetical protein